MIEREPEIRGGGAGQGGEIVFPLQLIGAAGVGAVATATSPVWGSIFGTTIIQT